MAKKTTKAKAAKKAPAKRREVVETACVPEKCPKCGSAERDGYTDVVTRDIRGETPVPFSSITWRRTTCRNCGQARRVRFYNP